MEPLVSIIIPTYKRSTEMLDRAIKSILNQSYTNWELLIVDDNGKISGFSNENLYFLRKYKNDARVKYIQHETNKGANAARNTGIRLSKGDLISFLDSDDEWLPNKLEVFIEQYNEDKDSSVFYSSYYVVGHNGVYIDDKNKPEGYIFYKEILQDRVSPTSAVMFKRECYDKVGGFDERLPARQDYDMWLRISRFYNFNYINQPLVSIYRDGHDTISGNYMNSVKGTEIVRDKIYSYLTDSEIQKYKNIIDKNHYNYIAIVCSRCEDFKLARHYSKMALKAKINIRSISILILVTFPKIFKFTKKAKDKLKINLS